MHLLEDMAALTGGKVHSQGVVVRAGADDARAPRPGPPGAGHQRAHDDHRRRRGPGDARRAAADASCARRWRGPRIGTDEDFLAERIAPAVGQGRDHLGGRADQRRAQGDPPPRRRLAAGHPCRDGRGHRRGRRRCAAARRAGAGRRSTSPATTGSAWRSCARALTEPVHLIATNAGYDGARGGQAGHRAGHRRGLRRAGGPLRQHGRAWASSTRCGWCARRCRTARRWPG